MDVSVRHRRGYADATVDSYIGSPREEVGIVKKAIGYVVLAPFALLGHLFMHLPLVLGRNVGRSRLVAFSGLRRTVIVLALLVPIVASSSARPALAATAWSGGGSGTATVVSDGTSGSPQFTYSLQVSCCASGSWTFSTMSGVSGSVV
jgi:hypothetical protein